MSNHIIIKEGNSRSLIIPIEMWREKITIVKWENERIIIIDSQLKQRIMPFLVDKSLTIEVKEGNVILNSQSHNGSS